jgi:hypothetical protein
MSFATRTPEELFLDNYQTNEGGIYPLSILLGHRHVERAASIIYNVFLYPDMTFWVLAAMI